MSRSFENALSIAYFSMIGPGLGEPSLLLDFFSDNARRSIMNAITKSFSDNLDVAMIELNPELLRGSGTLAITAMVKHPLGRVLGQEWALSLGNEFADRIRKLMVGE